MRKAGDTVIPYAETDQAVGSNRRVGEGAIARDGTVTRTAILDAAERLILERGFAGTPIDDVLEIAGVTKGAFFHHFTSKQELAHALIDRYATLDLGHLEDKMRRAEELSTDPLQQLLVFVGLFREEAEALTQPYPGCLMGSYCYEAGLFDDTVLDVISTTMTTWRERLLAKLEEVARRHPPRREVDLPSLADQVTVVFEGAYILSKVLADPRVVAAQLSHHRTYLELLFAPRDDLDAQRPAARGSIDPALDRRPPADAST